MERIAEGPRPSARVTGVAYLSYFVLAPLSALFTKGIVVAGNAAATAANLLAHEGLFRTAFAVGMASDLGYIVATALFYRLFGPANRSLALIAALFSYLGCAVQIFGRIFLLAALVILKNAAFAHAFSVEQVQASAMLSLALFNQVFSISFLLFASFEIVFGSLMFRSRFVPRFLGIWWMLAGVLWLSAAWPPLLARLQMIILPVAGAAEIALLLWLLVKGVDAEKWREAAGAERLERG